MEPAGLIQSLSAFITKRRFTVIALLGAGLVVLAAALVYLNQDRPAIHAQPVAQVSSPAAGQPAPAAAAAPLYHKKQLLFKRVAAETDLSAIRSSALASGYQALAAIPPAIVISSASVRQPRFISNYELKNYQALSNLGTQQYYSNTAVQQLLSSLSSQQMMNNLSQQQYLNNLSFQQTMNSLNTQQYLSNLSFQQYNNNLNFQTYLSNLNNQVYQNNLNNQSYLNNFNTFSNPSTYQPHIYTPPVQFYTPPVQFYNPPVQFYNPPSFNNFP